MVTKFVFNSINMNEIFYNGTTKNLTINCMIPYPIEFMHAHVCAYIYKYMHKWVFVYL